MSCFYTQTPPPTTPSPCSDELMTQGFNTTTQGCLYVSKINNNNLKDWTAAEAACQRFGSNVHLATLDTQQVGTFM